MKFKYFLIFLIALSTVQLNKADDFSDAAQGLADALAQGGDLTLQYLFQYAPDQVVQLINSVPGPFQGLLKELKFDIKPSVSIDRKNKVLVLKGFQNLSFLKSAGRKSKKTHLELEITLSPDLVRHSRAKELITPTQENVAVESPGSKKPVTKADLEKLSDAEIQSTLGMSKKDLNALSDKDIADLGLTAGDLDALKGTQGKTKKQTLVYMKPQEAQKLLDDSLEALAGGSQISIALIIPEQIGISSIADLFAQGKIKGTVHKFSDFARKHLDNLFSGNFGMIFTSQKYANGKWGLLYPGGVNLVGSVNLMRDWGNKVTNTILNLLGKTITSMGAGVGISSDKALSASIFIPDDINGLTGSIYLPGQIKICPGMLAGKQCKDKQVVVETEKLRIDLKVIMAGMQLPELQGAVMGGLKIYLPWQDRDDPLTAELTLTLDTETNLGIMAELEDLKLGKLPIELEDAKLIVKVNLKAIVEWIIDAVKIVIGPILKDASLDVADVAGTEGVAGVEEVGAVATSETVVGAAAFEAAAGVEEAAIPVELVVEDVAGAVEEEGENVIESLVGLLTSLPIDELGISGKVQLMGRIIEAEACINYDPESGDVNVMFKLDLEKGKAKDVLSLADIVDLFFELQKKELELAKKANIPGTQDIIKLMQSLINDEKKVKGLLDKNLKGFTVDSLLIYVAPIAGMCGPDLFTEGIEVEIAGKVFGVEVHGDLTISLALLDSLTKSKKGGDEEEGAEGAGTKPTAKPHEEPEGATTPKPPHVTHEADGGITKPSTSQGEEEEAAGGTGTKPTTKPKDSESDEPEGARKRSRLSKTKQGAGSMVKNVFGFVGQVAQIGLVFTGELGEIKEGPVKIFGEGTYGGPSILISLGWPISQKTYADPLFDLALSGGIEFDFGPEKFEADLEAKLSPEGLDIHAEGKLGNEFDAVVTGILDLNHILDAELTLDVKGGIAGLTKGVNDLFEGVMDEGKKELDKLGHGAIKDVGKAEELVKKAESKLNHATKMMDQFKAAVNECSTHVPAGPLLKKFTDMGIDAMKKLNPSAVIKQVTDFANMGYDAKLLKKQLKKQIAGGNNPLSNISGIQAAL